MKLFYKGKDGGPESKTTGYWLIESKKTFSIVLLCFDKGYRDAYHTHAFNAISWVLKGKLKEVFLDKTEKFYIPSWKPIYTPRECFHQVRGEAEKTWALSFRGPWTNKWKEYLLDNKYITLTHGRKVIDN